MQFSMEDVVSAITLLAKPPMEKTVPPRPMQQKPPSSTHANATNGTTTGNLLSRGIDVTELEDSPIKMLIYGPNRAGKTTLACDFPKPACLFSFEPVRTGGAASVKAKEFKGVKLFRFKFRREEGDPDNVFEGTSSAMRLVDELKVDRYFRTVIVDSATSYQDLFLQEILGIASLKEQMNFGEISGDQYRARSERVKEGLRPFLNLDKHTVIIAKEKDHNPPKEEKVNPNTGKVSPDMRPKALRGLGKDSFYAADLGGAAAMWLNDACDIVRLFMGKEVVTQDIGLGPQEVETGRYVRRLLTQYHPPYSAGLRTPHKNCPDYIDNPTFIKIEKVIRGETI